MRSINPLARRAERGLLLLLIVIGLVSASTATPGVASAASQAKAASRQALSSSSYPLTGYSAIRSNNVTYHNGPVIHNPDVKLIFEGSSWTATQMQTVQQYFTDVSGSSFEGILSQYSDSTGPISTTITVSGSVQDPNYNQTHLCSSGGPEILDTGLPTSPLGDPNNIYDEIQKEATAHNWSMTSSIFFVFAPSGTTVYLGNCSTTPCGYHSSYTTDSGITNTIYAVIPWPGTSCLTDGNALDTIINITSHEQFEAITNPTQTVFQSSGGGWYNSDCGSGIGSACEIGDKCSDEHPGIDLNGHFYSGVQGEYDNATHDCEYPAPPPVVNVVGGGAFYTIWQSFGGATGVLGEPTDSWYSVNGGQAQDFQGGSIDWSSATGTYEVHGAIYNEYANMSGPNGVLGFPTTDELPVTNSAGTVIGRVSYFYGNLCGSRGPNNSGSAIYYSSATGAHQVGGCIYNKYWNMSGPNSQLSFPTSDVLAISGGYVSYFSGTTCGTSSSGSIITYSSTYGAHEVQGCIYHEYVAVKGGPSGALGFPVTDEQAIAGGHVSYFAGQSCNGGGPNGSGSGIFDTPGTGAHEVHGCIYDAYQKAGGPTGGLGFPVSDEYTNGSGNRESDFQGGYIIWNGQAHVYLYGCPSCS
jgi:hypothetical protein